jgi:uncharacterized membrane protein YfcA
MRAMDAFTARRTLAQARLAAGVGALVAPRLFARVLGIDPESNPAAPYLTRLFGAREVYMAVPFLMPVPGLDETELAARAVPVDATDAIASFLGGVGGYLPWRAALPATVAGGIGTWLGMVASRRDTRPA